MSADGEDLPDTLSEKATNITVAMAEGIAEKRGRDKEALTKTITEAEAYTASAAVEANLVDFVAVNMEDLLEQLDGRETETASGTVTMETEAAGGAGGGDEPRREVLRVRRGPERHRAAAYLRGAGPVRGAPEPRSNSARAWSGGWR